LSIGTAKPTAKEQGEVKHHFIDSHTVTDEVNSARFEKEALQVLNEAFETKETVILVGGSGMFIDALCIGLDDIPSSKELKNQIQVEYEKNGLNPLLEELQTNDPEYFDQVDKKNAMRVLRAIEVTRLTGEKFSTLRKQAPEKRPFHVKRFAIHHERDELYSRINTRVDMMMEAGLLEEVKSVKKFSGIPSLNTVGFKELFSYIDGHCSLDEAVDKIKQNTRRYAKRQLTWLRRHTETHWIDHNDENKMKKEVVDALKL